jgi:hypothetical protein
LNLNVHDALLVAIMVDSSNTQGTPGNADDEQCLEPLPGRAGITGEEDEDLLEAETAGGSHVQWSKLSFRELKAAYFDPKSQQPFSSESKLARRYGDVRNFVESDRIWPPVADSSIMFLPALCEVLSRLPHEVFYSIEEQLGIALELPKAEMLAVNVPAKDFIHPQTKKKTKVGTDLIVFFHPSWKLSREALVGLIAHEIAHSYVEGKDYTHDEALADATVREWGFSKELQALEIERVHLCGKTR